MKRGPNYLRSHSKRALDIVGGLALLGMLAPVALATATALSWERRSLRKPFYTQDRIGYDREPFTIRKLRTLPEGSDVHTKHYGSYDPRARRVARCIRIIGLDEIPQLVSVIRGDMSLAGPRPPLLKDAPDEAWRFQMKPGLVGASQIERRRHPGKDQTEHCRNHDSDYLNNATLIGDVAIITTTPFRLCVAALAARQNRQAAQAEA